MPISTIRRYKGDPMRKCSEKIAILSGELRVESVGDVFREFVREQVREIIIGVMTEEVESLCGPKHGKKENGEFYRAGSAPGYILHEGRRQELKRPRVRRKTPAGSREATLTSYAEAQDEGELRRRMLSALKAGVSGREQASLHDKSTPGTSKSTVSRLWAREGEKVLSTFRSRAIDRPDWLVLMLDGVVLERDLVAVVALGVAAEGTKMLLDFELGATDNSETAKNLLARLTQRGFSPAKDCRLLCVLDGSPALKTAVSAYYPESVFQRCLVHKERNLRRYLRKSEQPELTRHFDRLRKAQGAVAGREAYNDLERFLTGRNEAALQSFQECGEELIALHALNVPSTLNTSLLSTNLIENPFRNVRRKTERVCRWRKDTNQASRWLSMALLEAESGFRRLRNHRDLTILHGALRIHRE